MEKQSWKDAILSAIEALSARVTCSTSGKSQKVLRPVLPYCFRSVGEGKKLIPLNRDCKPVGSLARYDEWQDYREYPWLHVEEDEPVAVRGDFWLFDDGYPPWRSRKDAERLLRLMRMLIEPDFDLKGTSGKGFRMLAKDRSNLMVRGLEGGEN